MAESSRPRSPAPNIQPVFIWPTPEEADLIFYVEKDGRLPANKQGQWEYGDSYPDVVKYPDHKLIYVSPQSDEKWSRWYYASDRINQDEYNWQHSVAGLGNAPYDTVVRTYLTPRSEYDSVDPAQGTAMPDVPADKFAATAFVLSDRRQIKVEEQLDSIYILEERTYVEKVTLSGHEFDDFTGLGYLTTRTHYFRGEIVTGVLTIEALVAAPTNAYWGLQSDGIVRSAQQISDNWWLVTERPVIGGEFSGGIITVRTYTTNIDYYWPPVLDTYTVKIYPLRNGGIETYPSVDFVPDAYRGPCAATVVETWSPTPVAIPKVDQMLPRSIRFACPYFTANIPPCLHPAWALSVTTGTTDPRYEFVVDSQTFAATNYTTWPATITASDEQRPFRGGYLRTTVTVTQPS